MKKIVLSNDQINNIISLYNSGLSCNKIAIELNYSASFIQRILYSANIKLRAYHQLNRKHFVDENYFNEIDCEEKAYFLGFLFADGNVNKHSNQVVLKLNSRDKEILIRLNKLISNECLIFEYGDNSELRFSSKNIKDNLIKYGCIPNKSLKLKFPNIDNKYVRHFIRGYFDGDGSIVRYRNDFVVIIVSTEDFCNGINIYFSGVIDHPKYATNRGNNITCTIGYKGNRKVLKFLEMIYMDSTIYLNRKYKKYLELVDWCNSVDKKRPGRYV